MIQENATRIHRAIVQTANAIGRSCCRARMLSRGATLSEIFDT
jgi:hypothetical protein